MQYKDSNFGLGFYSNISETHIKHLLYIFTLQHLNYFDKFVTLLISQHNAKEDINNRGSSNQ